MHKPFALLKFALQLVQYVELLQMEQLFGHDAQARFVELK
jgi:hypothetical protein